MERNELLHYCIDKLKRAGAEKVECSVSFSEKKELNIDSGEMTLLRTTFNTSLGISVIKDQKKGSTSINKTDKGSIDQAVEQVIELAKASQPDEAFDIAEKQPTKSFSKGDETADLDSMYNRMEEFLGYVNSTYPTVNLEQAVLDFTYSRSYFQNSNGVNFDINKGMYGFYPGFLSKDGKDTSSMNGTFFSALNLDKPLHKYCSIDTLLKQSTEQIRTQQVQNKFVGDVVVTPDCVSDFLGFITTDISDGKMITGNSLFKDKLNEQITHPGLTLHSHPVSEEICDGYFVTDDGYIAENNTIIDKGVLKTHLLSLYGSRKLGKSRAVNDGDAYLVDPGSMSRDSIISGIDKGVLLARFSGGSPANNGDFSGVAKNSYYIEDGEIKYPISETMVSGNIREMFENMGEVSKDRVDFGYCIFPWISFKGLTVS
ncbi:MAG: TldD/PmbA family protein [Candidatus Marinimicrobia bacterium]|jgi:PmbA protein|nr:TldD/PmbA family protein [Candidatus Neomarinimicrobiota bacterium]MDP6853443.1 TldD/PmbA family protein [Candidatus Neomarinimicrobiota bacterium]MDP6936782.1 TldD/PmbA family protein [Candidatus Neomarinimicrobiota bacterium]